MFTLSRNDWIVREILQVHSACLLWSPSDHNRSIMRIEEAFVSRVWVSVGISIAMVCSMVPAPGSDRSLSCAGARDREDDFQEVVYGIGSVGP